MKKITIAILIIAAGATIFSFWERQHYKLPDIKQFSPEAVLENIQSQISAPGPLRGKVNDPNSHLTADGVFTFTNEQRLKNNLPELITNQKLTEAAVAKVKDMFAKQYFEHISPLGAGPADLAKQAGYEYVAVGENLALGNYKDDQALVEAWMNSPGHRANILNNKFSELGVAVGRGIFEGQQTWLAVQEFGRPASACPRVDLQLKSQIENNRLEVEGLQAQVEKIKADLETSKPQSKEEVDAYNQKVREYNDLVKIFNNRVDVLKNLESQYNEQVKAYNQCLKN